MSLDAFMKDQGLPLPEKMKRIYDEVQECKACSLNSLSMNKPGERLLGHGDEESKILFIAQNPSFRRVKFEEPKIFGTWENRNDRLFIENLAKVGVHRKDVYVTNLVKCSTSENLPPDHDQILACKKFIMQEIQFMKPSLLVPIGGISQKAFKGRAGTWSEWSGIRVFGIWHPSYVLRTGLEPQQADYVKNAYLLQFKELVKNPAFDKIKGEPFQEKDYP